MSGELSRSFSSRRSWAGSFRDASDVFRREGVADGGGGGGDDDDDEEKLKWAALEKLQPAVAVDDGGVGGGADRKLGVGGRRALLESVLKVAEEDNEHFLRRLRGRIDRVGLELPQIEVRYENLSVEADIYVGSRALPTLWNATLNAVENIIGVMQLSSSKLRNLKILNDVTGILKPKRLTLLLGPPASGKTTFLLALSGKLDHRLSVSGKVTYCGHELHEFVPQRTSAYISQLDIHNGEMTIRETFDFAARCLGVGYRYEMLAELSRREKDAGIKPDPEIDAFMKATSMNGQKCSMTTDYILKVLGLDICADILVGDEMRRGISGGQKKRVTIGEMLAGPARALFMDEVSTGLDSATTFQIVKFIRQMVHVFDATVVISLLQPAPETFELFDDIILLSEGQIVYQGPRENAVEFFESIGFKCPKRKAVADFLQEVTSKRDQENYWCRRDHPYQHIPVPEFVRLFKSFHIGQQIIEDLKIPYDGSNAHLAAISREKHGISSWELLKACLSRERLLMKRNAFIHIFKVIQITFLSLIAMTVFLRTEMPHQTILDGTKYLGALFYLLTSMMFNGMSELALTIYKLPVFYKQRDLLFFPAWAFGLSYWFLRIPSSLFESGIMIILTYYVMGFAPSPDRFFRQFLVLFLVHQMALSLFRLVAAISRTMVMANVFGSFALLVVFVLGGFLISKDDIQRWWIWGYWSSPLMYGLNSLAVNEFLDTRWGTPNYATNINATTVGQAILKSRGMFVKSSWYWIGVGELVASCLLLNALFILALTYLNPIGSFPTVIVNEDELSKKQYKSLSDKDQILKLADNLRRSDTPDVVGPTSECPSGRGMVLPFQPLSIAFNHVNYYVDMPAQMKNQGIEKDRLQLLCDVSGAFRPGVLTALVGVSGAGKTTLMDVLAGRKTSGNIEGSISISGYPKKQETFVRICGYCEQDDIHSPHLTIHESLIYSAWLRLAPTIDRETLMMFVEEVMELVELSTIKDALVGLPGVDGLSTEQRKRLTIAVELVANPSIIFMDEPTSGLDARAAAIVMRTVRKTVDTGRTVVCTIHQPSIDIFESFDELLLMKIGGQVIYSGPLGHHSLKLIEYFEAIPGVPKIAEGYNPATWVLDITSPSAEAKLNLDFAKLYSLSVLYQENQQLITELSVPPENSRELHFDTKYSKSFSTQSMACIWKQYWSYWRNPQYNAMRFFMTILIGLLFGTIYWQKGQKTNTQQDLLNLLGAIYAAVYFMGVSTSASLQPVVAIERTVFYREKAAGMYSPMAYAFAQVVVEMMYMSIQGFLYSLILFSMIGLTWRIDNFLWFFFFLTMSFAYLALYGMMVVGLTPNHQIAGIVSSFFYSFWNLFSGFLIARPAIPVWWRWYYWADPVSWTIYGVLASQLGNKENLVEIPGASSLTVKVFMKDILGYDRNFLGYVALVHFCFVFVFFFVFAYSIKYINFQKR